MVMHTLTHTINMKTIEMLGVWSSLEVQSALGAQHWEVQGMVGKLGPEAVAT